MLRPKKNLSYFKSIYRLGGKWWGGANSKPLHVNKRCIYIDNNLEMSQSSIVDGYFRKHKNKELSLEIVKTLKLTEVKVETIELNGKSYLKSDLEEALNKLTPV